MRNTSIVSALFDRPHVYLLSQEDRKSSSELTIFKTTLTKAEEDNQA